MKIRRTISIDKSDLDILKPFLESNGNNLSLALRHLIDEHRQRIDMNKISGDQQRVMVLRSQIVEARIASLIPIPLLKWMTKNSQGVPPLGTFRVILEKYTKLLGIENLSVNDYIKLVGTHLDIFGYHERQHIEASADLKNIRISFEGEDADNLKMTVIHYSCLLAHYPLKLRTKKIIESPNLIIIDYEPCSSEDEAYKSVMEYFGSNQFIFEEINKNIQFWRNASSILRADHYEDIIISRDILLQILKSREFSNQLCDLISVIYSAPVEETDYKALLKYIEELCKTNGLVHKIEYNDNEIRIYHTFDDKEIIRIINETITKTLEMAGQSFGIKRRDKMTILNRKMVIEVRPVVA